MRSIYIVGPSGSGKTALAVSLALKLQEAGKRVAYFKPVGFLDNEQHPDEDAVLMRDVLGMPQPPTEMVLFNVTPLYLSRYEKSPGYLERVIEGYRTITSGADVAIIGAAPSPYAMSALGLDAASIAAALETSLLLVQRVINDLSADLAIFYNEFFRSQGLEVIGTIFNHVPRALWDKAHGVYQPALEDRGFRVLGVIPQRPEISNPTVGEVYELLGGELLAGETNLDRLVEDVVVGAMTLESALHYFRRAANKLVITGGDRADLALAALETNAAGIVLTGGLYPDIKVVRKAEELAVPVILVGYDTYTVTDILRGVARRIRPGEKRSVEVARENLEKYCRWPEILEELS